MPHTSDPNCLLERTGDQVEQMSWVHGLRPGRELADGNPVRLSSLPVFLPVIFDELEGARLVGSWPGANRSSK